MNKGENLYRLLISDDKFHIRKGLSLSVDWKAMGFSLVGCFEDGSEVIAYLKNQEVDVVFSDIEMPEVSGIDLASWIAENRPEVLAAKVGYSDVRYFLRVFKNYTGYSVKEYCRLLH